MRQLAIYIALIVILAAGFLVPFSLSQKFIAFGEGPDELAHLDNIFFRFTRPESTIQVTKGLMTPGAASAGQGHQAPLFYIVSATLLHLVLSPADVGPFWDYQAGLRYSSFGLTMGGGSSACNIHYFERPSTDIEKRLRGAIAFLRTLSCFYFVIGIVLMYAVSRLFFKDEVLPALAATILYAGNPTAIWRSSFVTNDNLVATLGVLPFLFALRYLDSGRKNHLLISTLFSALCFLTKYTGIACLSSILVAIVIRPGDSSRSKCLRLILSCAVFSSAIAPEIIKNILVEGEPFFFHIVAREFPWLYKPSSILDVIFGSQYLPMLLSRFWIEFHNVGFFDKTFPMWKADIWQYFSIVAVSGLILIAIKPRLMPVNLRGVLIALASFVAIIAVIIDFASAFPLVGGRYLHPMLAPITLLIVLGLRAFFRVILRLDRFADPTAVFICSSFAALGFSTTYFYQVGKYASCRSVRASDVEAGAEFGSADLDGDGIDEIFAYHRHPGRLYFLKQFGSSYELKPKWTRAFGLQADKIQSAKINLIDDRSVIVLFRPANLGMFFVRPANFLSFDPQLSPYPDRAVAISGLWLSRKHLRHTSQLLAGQVDQKPGEEIMLFNPGTGYWNILKALEATGALTLNVYDATNFGGVNGNALLLPRVDGPALLATYHSDNGELRISSLSEKGEFTSLQIEQNVQLISIDVNGDGNADLVSWHTNEMCLEVRQLDLNKQKKWSLSEPRKGCLLDHNEPFAVTTDYQIFKVSTGGTSAPEALAAADKRTGVIYLFQFTKAVLEDSTFSLNANHGDFGFLRSTERIEPFSENSQRPSTGSANDQGTL